MSQVSQIIMITCILIGIFLLVRKFQLWKTKQARRVIVKDLKAQKAFDPPTAVDLPYASREMFRVGLRDHRPMALAQLVHKNIVAVTRDGKYYLQNESVLERLK